MNVTRNVMNDLLPVYFSGEASADTRTLVEEYFRENPEFERMARGSARSLEMLQSAVAVAPEAKKEKRDLESVHKAVWRHKLHFGLALFFTFAPLAFVYSKGHLEWMMVRNQPWGAAIYWLAAAMFWILYIARPRQRTASLVAAIFFVIMPVLILHGTRGAQSHVKDYLTVLIWAVFFWCMAAILVAQYFARARRRTSVLTFAIFATAFPIPFWVYSILTSTPTILSSEHLMVWVIAAVMWIQYFWLRRKAKANANADEEECY
jgi:heme/copper-type cytochrome/quinol oxidase subunit 4